MRVGHFMMGIPMRMLLGHAHLVCSMSHGRSPFAIVRSGCPVWWVGAPQRVLICGFAEFTFMVELISALDRELPQGSDIMLFSKRTTRDTVGGWRLNPLACPGHLMPHSA